MIHEESAFDPLAVSSAGAMGLLQMYDQFGSWERAVAAYHAGPKR